MTKRASLAARYRPRTFAEVAGQDMVKAVLSRAAAEDSAAPAYLFSGTRGVGKTTVARIFSRALNCAGAPTPEPCNQCPQCRSILLGAHVDVSEIDGASNNSVEDARALREGIGYAPMEGRHKIFVIDEAHMLSRHAFNALLKTLEEPPPRVVFIFATTEAHKFPATIVSRCQHFVFRHLPEDALRAHLAAVLGKEGIGFEEGAVRLIARRAAGSVRDGMSLLDQVLALGGEGLTAAVARDVLGVAGQEVFEGLFEAMHRQDCAAAADICRRMLADGLDTGFFLRELINRLRDLFLLKEGGEAVMPSLRLSADEEVFLRDTARRFPPAHLHAAWQTALEARRGIVYNPEPGAALELLLFNLVMLPRLLPLSRLGWSGAAGDERAGGQSQTAPPAGPANAPAAPPETAGPHPDWNAFCAFCEAELRAGRPAPAKPLLSAVTADWRGEELRLTPRRGTVGRQLALHRREMLAALRAYGAPNTRLVLLDAPKARNGRELVEEFRRRGELAPCMEVLGARLESCTEKVS
ncbi:MAG: DNA polymerase III subunit gamma/tau [Desulfovibrio sp.]|jgi:DNA polymerase-3 subunit gamma/tau|nr:DNA polymerase III subunit gamma/tau [Desulfovibrio sp.]